LRLDYVPVSFWTLLLEPLDVTHITN